MQVVCDQDSCVQERDEKLLDTLQENDYLKRTQQDNELRIKR